jgi:hypothetical protein
MVQAASQCLWAAALKLAEGDQAAAAVSYISKLTQSF